MPACRCDFPPVFVYLSQKAARSVEKPLRYERSRVRFKWILGEAIIASSAKKIIERVDFLPMRENSRLSRDAAFLRIEESCRTPSRH